VAEREACRAGRVGAGQDACRTEQRPGAGRTADFVDRRDRRGLWDEENTGDLARRVHLAADAWADSAAWADRDVGRSDDRQKAADRGYRLAAGHGFQWEEGRDCQWAKDVAAACRVARTRQPQAERLQADPAGFGRARRGAARAQRRVYLGRLVVKADRAELAVLASVRMAVESEAQPERKDVELLELQAEPQPEQQGSGLKGRAAQSPVLAARLARQRPEQPEQPEQPKFDSPELVVWPLVRRE